MFCSTRKVFAVLNALYPVNQAEMRAVQERLKVARTEAEDTRQELEQVDSACRPSTVQPFLVLQNVEFEAFLVHTPAWISQQRLR